MKFIIVLGFLFYSISSCSQVYHNDSIIIFSEKEFDVYLLDLNKLTCDTNTIRISTRLLDQYISILSTNSLVVKTDKIGVYHLIPNCNGQIATIKVFLKFNDTYVDELGTFTFKL